MPTLAWMDVETTPRRFAARLSGTDVDWRFMHVYTRKGNSECKTLASIFQFSRHYFLQVFLTLSQLLFQAIFVSILCTFKCLDSKHAFYSSSDSGPTRTNNMCVWNKVTYEFVEQCHFHLTFIKYNNLEI